MDILKYLNSISITVTLDNIIVASILIILIVIVIYFIYGTIKFFLKKKFCIKKNKTFITNKYLKQNHLIKTLDINFLFQKY